MISVTTQYTVHTGNLFGVSSGWPEAFIKAAFEIIGDAGHGGHCDTCNPVFAGAWIEVYDLEIARRIEARWRQLLPLAVASMNDRWRAEYEADLTLAGSR